MELCYLAARSLWCCGETYSRQGWAVSLPSQRTLQMPVDGSQSPDNPEQESEPKKQEQSFKLRLIKTQKKSSTSWVWFLAFCFFSRKVHAFSFSMHPEGLSVFLSAE